MYLLVFRPDKETIRPSYALYLMWAVRAGPIEEPSIQGPARTVGAVRMAFMVVRSVRQSAVRRVSGRVMGL